MEQLFFYFLFFKKGATLV